MHSLIRKILLSTVMFVMFLLVAVPSAVSAATFTPRTTAPSETNKYYIHTSNGGLNQCIEINTSTGSCLPNCVGYAWGRAYEILGKKPNLSKGNAENWYSYNKKGGYYKYGSTPKLGAIMCWGGNHVAVVEKIEGNYITISESSYGGARFNVVKKTISKMESRTSGFQGYIYIGDFGDVTASPMTIRFYPNKGTGTMNDVSTAYGNSFTIPECKFQRTGHTFQGWAGYRPSDKTYFVKGVGWVTQEVINEKGYQKRVYQPGEMHTLDTSWTKDPIEQNIIGFAAFWAPNFFRIRFDENGASGSVNDMSVQLTETFRIPDVSNLSKPGYKFLYWNVHRTSDNTYYVGSTGWFTEAQIQANGYTKRAYAPGGEFYIDESSWLSNNPANNNAEFVFTAVWERTGEPIPDESKGLPFIDVKSSDWFYGAVEYVYQNEMMSGLTSTVFGPYDVLSREQFAAILYRMNGSPAVNAGTSPFKDVPTNTWFTNAVIWANANKVISGYNANTFGTGDAITREQMAVMMYRYGSYMGYNVSGRANISGFADAGFVSSYAKEALQWAVSEGIISGNANGTLNPQGSATRAECASIIMRFDKKY